MAVDVEETSHSLPEALCHPACLGKLQEAQERFRAIHEIDDGRQVSVNLRVSDSVREKRLDRAC
jgi:hypothetical protein